MSVGHFGSWSIGCKLGALLKFFQGYPDCLIRLHVEVELACSLRELFPFPITFLYRAFWSASISFVCPTFKIASGKCTIMFVLPMYNIMFTSESTVLIYPRSTKVIRVFYLSLPRCLLQHTY